MFKSDRSVIEKCDQSGDNGADFENFDWKKSLLAEFWLNLCEFNGETRTYIFIFTLRNEYHREYTN